MSRTDFGLAMLSSIEDMISAFQASDMGRLVDVYERVRDLGREALDRWIDEWVEPKADYYPEGFTQLRLLVVRAIQGEAPNLAATMGILAKSIPDFRAAVIADVSGTSREAASVMSALGVAADHDA